MKYCSNCGKELNNGKCDKCGNKKELIQENKNSKVIKILLWIFLFPIMLCVFIWKTDKINKKYKIPAIIGIIILTIIIGIISTANENKLKEKLIKNCYSEEVYNKIDETFGISNINGSFEENQKCENLIIKDAQYNEISIKEQNGKLVAILVKDGKMNKCVYAIDKSYDIYDSNTLELKQSADETLKKTREEKELKEQQEKERALKEKKEAEEKAKKLKIFTDVGLSEDDSEEAYNILQKCGIATISKLEKDTEIDGVIFYKASSDNYDLTISIYNNRLHFVTSGTLVLYDRDANLTRNINDYIFTTEEKSELKTQAEYYVKQFLKAPSTAEFPGTFLSPFEDWAMEKDVLNYKLSSYVDSQNSFGAIVRSKFYMEFKKDNKNIILTKFNFDGQKIK